MTAITDYDTLVAEAKAWCARSDQTFSNRFPVFVALAESRIYDGYGQPGDPLYSEPLRSTVMETTGGTVTITSGVGTLDEDVLAIKSLTRANDQTGLTYITPQLYQTTSANSSAGDPYFYTIEGRTLRLVPTFTGTLNMVSYNRFDAITSSNTTGPLIQQHGLLYLNGVMIEAMSFMQEVELAGAWLARFRAMIAGINRAAADLRTSTRVRSVARPIGA